MEKTISVWKNILSHLLNITYLQPCEQRMNQMLIEETKLLLLKYMRVSNSKTLETILRCFS
jgi:hypothetical protein